MEFYTPEQMEVHKLISNMHPELVKQVFTNYIKDKSLYAEYIELITVLNKEYIRKSNQFIQQMKRDVNFFYQDSAFGTDLLKNIDINNRNWFWFARVLRDSEDEEFAKYNFLQPTYLVKRLKPIVDALDPEKDYGGHDDEFEELISVINRLAKKYKIEGNEDNVN